jgi:hypothetical protein
MFVHVLLLTTRHRCSWEKVTFAILVRELRVSSSMWSVLDTLCCAVILLTSLLSVLPFPFVFPFLFFLGIDCIDSAFANFSP